MTIEASQMDSYYKSYFRSITLSILISLAISWVMNFLFPWPFNFIGMLAAFILWPVVMMQRRRFTHSSHSGNMRTGFFGANTTRYVCLVCTAYYKGETCPRCGSKMKKAEF